MSCTINRTTTTSVIAMTHSQDTCTTNVHKFFGHQILFQVHARPCTACRPALYFIQENCTRLEWIEFNAPPDTVCHFGGGIHSQSLECYWQRNNKEKTQYKSQKYTHKHNTNQRKQTTKRKNVETKLPWFSHLLQHSARKWCGLILQRPRAPHGPTCTRKKLHKKARQTCKFLVQEDLYAQVSGTYVRVI